MKDQAELKSKIEKSREAREARLAKEHNNDGSKAPLHIKSNTYRASIIVFAIIVLVGALIWASVGFGFAQQHVPAVKVDKEALTVAEYNYMYNSAAQNVLHYAQQMGVEVNFNDVSPLAQKPGQTWGELIESITNEQVQSMLIADAAAKEKKLTLDNDDNKRIDAALENFKKSFPNEEEMSKTLYKEWGEGVNIDVVRSLLEKQALASKYMRLAPKDIKFDDKQVEKIYADKKDSYDAFDFMFAELTVPVEPVKQPNYPDTSKEKDKEKLKALNEESAKLHKEYQAKLDAANAQAAAKAKELAKEAEASIKDEASFSAFVDKHKELYKENPGMREIAPYRFYRVQDLIASPDLLTFLQDGKRKANDLLARAEDKNPNVVELALFNKRERDLSPTMHAAMRVITKGAAQDTYKKLHKLAKDKQLSDKEAVEAWDAAKAALEKYLETNKTVEKMKETEIADYSSTFIDMTDFVKSTNPFIGELGLWISDTSRKPGDMQVFEDDLYGLYGVNFIEQTDVPAWKSTLIFKEASDKFNQKFQENLKVDVNQVKRAWGYRLTDLAPFIPKNVPANHAAAPAPQQAEPATTKVETAVTSTEVTSTKELAAETQTPTSVNAETKPATTTETSK